MEVWGLQGFRGLEGLGFRRFGFWVKEFKDLGFWI